MDSSKTPHDNSNDFALDLKELMEKYNLHVAYFYSTNIDTLQTVSVKVYSPLCIITPDNMNAMQQGVYVAEILEKTASELLGEHYKRVVVTAKHKK